MTDIQIRECFGIESSAPDRVLRNDEEILQSIKNNIGISEIFGDCNINDVLQEIRDDLSEYNIYDHEQVFTDYYDAFNTGIHTALIIIDKHIKEIEDIGDYPDEIPNQFDNLTGSMNV